MRIPMLAAAMSVAALGAAHAANTLAGAGAIGCAQYNSASSQHEVADVYFSWAQGFMSGVNEVRGMSHASVRDLASHTVEQQRAYLDAYCLAHPDARYGDGVVDMYGKFPAVAPPAH